MRTGRRHKSTYLGVLFVMTLVALVLPRAWTGKLMSLAQVLVPFQDAATAVADTLADDGVSDREGVPRETYDALQRQKEALEHQTAALALRVVELERDVNILTATRLWNANGRLGEKGRLIPARVITDDLLAWRSSRLINAGALQGVSEGALVTSRHFTIDAPPNAVTRGMAVLLGEAFIGVVEQVGTHTARVLLLSDVSAGRKVRIGRLHEEGFTALDRDYWLVGRGGEVMEIRDAEWQEVEEGRIQVGDIVLSDPAGHALPAAMTIGKIVEITLDRKNPLLAVLTVKGSVDMASLRRVYVFDPGPDGSDQTRR